MILFLVVLAVPFVIEWTRLPLDERSRNGAPGHFADLSQGRTHYKWHGPSDGPVVVLVHGLTTPSYVWASLLPGLIGEGYRVLRYDLYGRGFSDRPTGAQTDAFFIRQLSDLLADQGVDGPVPVVGYSMGGSIAAVFASAHPEAVSRLVLLAPAGTIHSGGKLAEFARRVPVLGDWVMYALGGLSLVRGAAKQPGPPELVADLALRQRLEIQRRGYLAAVLSSQRNLLADDLNSEHHAIVAAGLPVMAIWGAEDEVIPLAAMERLAEWNPTARHVIVEGAGHGLGYTHVDEVLEAILAGLEVTAHKSP